MTPVKNNLVALGSAAILAVYTAGYVRTREAAERFAAAERRPPPEQHPQPVTAPPTPTPPVAAKEKSAVKPVVHESLPPRPQTKVSRNSVHRAVPVPVDSAGAPVADSVVKPTTSAPPVSAPAPVVVAPSRDSTFKVTTPSTDTTQAADRPLKDGVYSGWGTSRHGDIQATVSIKNGKIAEAFISECMTQYSCSWIAALPPQVLARQSAEVDYVSGATQSTNAFYYAVVNALKKAK